MRTPTPPAALTSAWKIGTVVVGVLLSSCGTADSNAPPVDTSSSGTQGVGGGGVGGGEDSTGKPCAVDGEIVECSIHNEFGCLAGTQQCVDGVWSSCDFWKGATAQEQAEQQAEESGASAGHDAHDGGVPTPGGMSNRIGQVCTAWLGALPCPGGEYCTNILLGLGVCAAVDNTCGAGGTTANACDPACHAIAPTPPDFSEAIVAYPWDEGGIGNLPADALEEGLPNLCNDFSTKDCQFDYHCTAGTCEPYVPDSTIGCAGSDITVGIPCGTTVPVCNRGATAITLGAGDQLQYEVDPSAPVSANSCGAFPGATGSCSLSGLALAGGECASVDCPTIAAYDGAWIKAKIGGADCNCNNNWSWYEAGVSCEEPSCGGGVNLATAPVEVALFTWVDRSGSMSNSRQNIVCRGFHAFLGQPTSAGLGWEYRFWPDGDDYNASCPTAGCGGCQDGVGAPVRTHFSSVLLDYPNNFKMSDVCTRLLPYNPAGNSVFKDGKIGGTPTTGALRGALARATAYKALPANADKAVVAVMVTDGEPAFTGSACDQWPDAVAEAATARAAGVYTAAIGIDMSSVCTSFGTDNCGYMNQLGREGGTGRAVFLNSTDPANITAALNNIQNQFACARSVPALPTGVTPNDLSVVWTNGGSSTTMTYVGTDVGDCTGAADEFYYNTGLMTLCTAACGAVTSAIGSNIEFVVPCGPAVAPITTHDEFTIPVDACDEPGTYPKWTQILFNTTTPGTTSIKVTAQTDFGGSYLTPYEDIATITTDGSGTASLAGPLGPRAFAYGIDIQLESTVDTTVIPNLAPSMNSYEVHYTCEYTE